MSLLNKLVKVEFLDHVMGDIHSKPEPCIVYGRLIKIDKEYIVVQYWESKESEDDTEAFAIVLSTVTSISVLNVSSANQCVFS